MTSARGGARRLLAVTLITLALASCGRKGLPVAPERRLPVSVESVHGVVYAGLIELSWTLPGRRVDNTRLRDASIARVFRAEDQGEGEPKPAMLARGRIGGYAEIVAIRLADSNALQGDRLTVRDTRDLTLGRRYTYVVTTVDADGRESVPSRPVSLRFIAAPLAPRDIAAEAGDGEVRLSWRPPAQFSDGSEPSGILTYEVLRASTPQAPLALVTREAVSGTAFTDHGLENDQSYQYAVRTIRTEGMTRAVSEPTPRVAVSPVDITPPSAPRDLVAIPSERTVRLSWRPSPEPDVAGYIVYRATANGALERIASAPTPATVFVDRDLAPGRYRYAVTAEDAGSRRNESARSNEVTVSVP